jgi:ParB-like chromosome segregation protein Spo0J
LHLAYAFDGAPLPVSSGARASQYHPAKCYRNPVIVAQDWQQRLDDGAGFSRADLARQLGVSRARVTQVLGLLELAPEEVTVIAALGDPLPQPIVSERLLRPLRKLNPAEQQRMLAVMVPVRQECGTRDENRSYHR